MNAEKMANSEEQGKKRGSGGRTMAGIVRPDPRSVDPHMRPWAEFVCLIYDELYATTDPAERLSQNMLGKKAHISPAYVSKIFSGRTGFSVEVCRSLVRELGGDPDEWASRHQAVEMRALQHRVDLDGLVPLPGLDGDNGHAARQPRDWRGRSGGRRGLSSLLRLFTWRGRERSSDSRREGMLNRVVFHAERVIQRAIADYYLTPKFSVLEDAPVDPRRRTRRRSVQRQGWVRGPVRSCTIRELFDESRRDLVLIAEPGLGKSTQLAKLAHQLAVEALQEVERRQIPVLLDLATYRRSERLEDWMVAQINQQYGVVEALARTWLEEDAVLPLLDGLDTVPDTDRAECVSQIRQFRGKCTGIVVSCRTSDEQLAHRIGALLNVELLAPTRRDVQDYLQADYDALADVHAALKADEDLWQLFQSPLMLKVIHHAYAGRLAPELREPGTLKERRGLIFDAYLKRRLEHQLVQNRPDRYRPDQILTWLTWLARTLSKREEQIFYLDRLGVDWMPRRGYLLFAALDGGLMPIFGMLLVSLWLLAADRAGVLRTSATDTGSVCLAATILISVMTYFMREDRPELSDEQALGKLISGGIVGAAAGTLVLWSVNWSAPGIRLLCLTFVWLSAIGYEGMYRPTTIPVEQIRWTWRPRISFPAAHRFHATGLTPLFLLASQFLLFGYLLSLIFPQPHWLWGAGTVVLMLIYAFGDNVEPSLKDKRPRPNEGIRRSVRFAMLIGSGTATVVAVSLTLLLTLGAPSSPSTRVLLVVALFAPLFGLLRAIRFGGMATILHWTIRTRLALAGNMPLRYQPFLHDCEQRILLHSSGNGFVFAHRLLQEHMDTSAEELTARLGLSAADEHDLNTAAHPKSD